MARRLPPLPSIGEIIRLYQLRAKKQLSQNFLLDMNITRKMVKQAGKLEASHVCEVGPGPGGITRSILDAGAEQLYVIEKDARFLPSLELLKEASGDRVRVFHGDVLNFDMSELFPSELAVPWEGSPPKIHLIGNLPFSVSTPLISQWLEQMSNRSGAWKYGRVQLTLTFQKEVAERLTANRNHRQRSRLSIMAQHLCKVKHRFTIPGRVFVPPPDVDVAVVHFEPLIKPKINVPYKHVEKVVRHIFQYRQKYCSRGIQTLFPPDRPELTKQMVHMAEIHPHDRPYELSLKEFDKLCTVYKQICDSEPGMFDYYFRSQENSAAWRNAKPVQF